MAATRWTAAENKLKSNLSSPTSATAVSVAAGMHGTDIGASVWLGGSRHLWLFGDTPWATAAGQTRNQCTWIQSCVALTTGLDMSTNTISYHCGGAPDDPLPYFDQGYFGGHPLGKYPMCGITLDDVTLVFGWHMVGGQTGWPFNTARMGTWAVRCNDIDQNPDDWVKVEVPIDLSNTTHDWTIGNGIVDGGDGYIYAWAQAPQYPDTEGKWAVCRFDRTEAKAGNLERPEWLRESGRGWRRDNPRRRRYHRKSLMPSLAVSNQSGAAYQRPDGQVGCAILPQTMEGPDPRVYTTYAPTPAHPFGPLKEQYNINTSDGAICYHAIPHPHLTWSGKTETDVLVCYSRSGGVGSAFSDARVYWPEFLKVTDP